MTADENANETNSRLQALEETLAHRQIEVDDLSDMVARQWKRWFEPYTHGRSGSA